MKTYSNTAQQYLFKITSEFEGEIDTDHIIAYDEDWAKYKFLARYTNPEIKNIKVERMFDVIT